LHPEIHRAKLRQHVAPFGAISVQILHAAMLKTVFCRNYNKLLTPWKSIRGKEWAKGLFSSLSARPSARAGERHQRNSGTEAVSSFRFIYEARLESVVMPRGRD
jgi:hypothetical protein